MRSMLKEVGPNQKRLTSAGYCCSHPTRGSSRTAPGGYCSCIVDVSFGSYLSHGRYWTWLIGFEFAAVLWGIAYGASEKICTPRTLVMTWVPLCGAMK